MSLGAPRSTHTCHFGHHIFTEKQTFQHPIVTARSQPKIDPTTNQSHHVHPRRHNQLAGWSSVQTWVVWGSAWSFRCEKRHISCFFGKVDLEESRRVECTHTRKLIVSYCWVGGGCAIRWCLDECWDVQEHARLSF